MIQTPDQYEKSTDSRQWTLDLISVYFQAYHEISVNRLRSIKLYDGPGIAWGVASFVCFGSPDPDYQAKRKQLTELASLRKRDT